jgi:GntR family transcriptional regulator/MocR family aminotransferase
MSEQRRLALLEVARRRDMILVEDTYEMETVAQKSPIPSLKSLDVDDRVIHIGSLSKAIAPGLRVGFVVANATVIDELRAIRRLIHRHPPGNTQRALALFIDRGYFHSFLRRVSIELDKRTAAFKQSTAKWLPEAIYTHHPGSSTFWMRFSEDMDLRPICDALRRQGMFIETGDRFFFADKHFNYIRMSVSQIGEQDIEKAIKAFASVLRHEQV